MATTRGYRRVTADWSRFAADLEATELDAAGDLALDRPRLLERLRRYLEAAGIAAEWRTIEATPDARLVTTLAMICPFAANEKQALLEAGSLAERADLLLAQIGRAHV